MRRKIRLIIRELGRVLARSNSLKYDYKDEDLIDAIAELIANFHANNKTLQK